MNAKIVPAKPSDASRQDPPGTTYANPFAPDNVTRLEVLLRIWNIRRGAGA